MLSYSCYYSCYSCNTNLLFEIERIKNKETGEYLTGEQFFDLIGLLKEDYKKENYLYEIIKLSIDGNAWYDSGINTGLYELSSPPEGEPYILSAIDNNKRDWIDELTDDEIEDINEMIIDQCGNYD